MYRQCTRVWQRAAYVVDVPVVMAWHGGVERRGSLRRLVMVTCATRWWEKLVGAGQGIGAGRATLEWSRDYGRTDLEVRERLRSALYVGLGSLGCQTAGDLLSYS